VSRLICPIQTVFPSRVKGACQSLRWLRFLQSNILVHRLKRYRGLTGAKHSFNAERVHTKDLAHWYKVTLKYNAKFLRREASAESAVNTALYRRSLPRGIASTSSSAVIPILKLGSLLSLPKGRKSQDMTRILYSPNSEDWVTWNFFQILFEQHPSEWRSHMASAARRRNSDLNLSFDGSSIPRVKFWTTVPSPTDYQEQRRKEMLSSNIPLVAARAATSQPVEGPSEIDITFEHDEFMVFVEAKLGSDISMSTTFDPQRNQIARNIDCLIDRAGTRTTAFWLLVRDVQPYRAYAKLIKGYRRDPRLLARELPHRDPETLAQIARNLTILRWGDFTDLVCGPASDPETAAVQRELRRRIVGYTVTANN
jgi:hypothetical protein